MAGELCQEAIYCQRRGDNRTRVSLGGPQALEMPGARRQEGRLADGADDNETVPPILLDHFQSHRTAVD